MKIYSVLSVFIVCLSLLSACGKDADEASKASIENYPLSVQMAFSTGDSRLEVKESLPIKEVGEQGTVALVLNERDFEVKAVFTVAEQGQEKLVLSVSRQAGASCQSVYYAPKIIELAYFEFDCLLDGEKYAVSVLNDSFWSEAAAKQD